MSKSIRFVLISYLMAFCLPLFAQKTQPVVDKETIKKVQQELKAQMPKAKIKTIKNDNGSVYIGEVEKKAKQGMGVMFFSTGDVYIGQWESDAISGYGSMIYANGDKYNGEWKEETYDGHGEMVYANGDKYDGEWKNGVREGQGEMIYANGDKYEGGWKDEKKEGNGTMIYKNGDKYEGEWADNQYNGQGTLDTQEYSYKGDWKNGKKCGDGSISFPTGNKYTGQWFEDTYHGQGVQTFANGDKYEGAWERGSETQGTMHYANGDKYEGAWHNKKRNGAGTMTYANGDKYVGDWVDGEKSGNGTQISSNGDELTGLWKDNSIYNGNGTITYPDGGKEEGEWHNGVFVNGYRKGVDKSGYYYDGSISNGKAINGSISFESTSFSMQGEIKNGEPFVSFTGTLPKESEYFQPIFSSTKWDSISSGSQEGKVTGYNDIVGVFEKDYRKSSSRKKPEETFKGRTIIVKSPYTKEQLIKLKVQGHLVSNKFSGNVNISSEYGLEHKTYLERGIREILILCITKVTSKWNAGKLISGRVEIAGTLNRQPCFDSFNLRTEGGGNIYVAISDKYGRLNTSELELLYNSSDPDDIADLVEWLSYGITYRKSVTH